MLPVPWAVPWGKCRRCVHWRAAVAEELHRKVWETLCMTTGVFRQRPPTHRAIGHYAGVSRADYRMQCTGCHRGCQGLIECSSRDCFSGSGASRCGLPNASHLELLETHACKCVTMEWMRLHGRLRSELNRCRAVLNTRFDHRSYDRCSHLPCKP